MAAESAACVEKLIRRLRHPDPQVRAEAGRMIGQMGPAAGEAEPTLVEMLRGEDVQDRRLAAHTLGCLGPRAFRAVPVLVNAMHDADEVVRDLAAAALRQIDGTTGRAGAV